MYISNKRKAIIDDGMNPELVKGADFDGVFEIPIIKAPSELIIPSGITPFTAYKRATDFSEAIGFYEMDALFADVLRHPSIYIEQFRKFSAFISPDCSLYRDAPLSVQLANVYRNRAIGHFYQQQGLYVIPQVRWGDEQTYSTAVLPEKIAFLGVEKHSIVAISSYGCISGQDNKHHFKAGLESMLLTIEPKIVLVYGSMPKCVFDDYKDLAQFVQYRDWISRKKGGNR